MKIVSLNVWQGKLKDPLLAFLKREAETTEIFCFQEMTSSFGSSDTDLFSAIARVLPGFQGFFEATQDEKGIEIGLAVFIKKDDAVEKEGDYFVYRTRNAMVGDDWRTWGRNAQFIEFSKSGKEYALVNFHGLADGEGRQDSPARIGQSHELKKLMNLLRGSKIVCGDFNLTQGTKSLAIIDAGMRNLINESGITSTRNHFFLYPDRFCDWILVDLSVNVKNFQVLPDEISDHLALTLTFEE